MTSPELHLGADGRSLELRCPAVHLFVSVHEAGVVRLRLRGPRGSPGAAAARPSYAVVGAPAADAGPVRFHGEGERVRVETSELALEIDRRDCRVRAVHRDGTVLVDEPPGAGFFEAPGPALVRSVADGERFYGFGERTGALDKRGRAMTFWNSDAYDAAHGGYPPDADPLYQSIPFFVGLRQGTAYGVFLDDTHRLRFDMGASQSDRYTLASEGRELDTYLIAGPRMRDVLQRYTALTGRAPLPPRWALGYHQSRWGYSPDSRVLDVARELRARALPADALWLDIQHLDGFRSFTFDPAGFSRPAALTSELEALGFRTVSIVDPGLKVDPGWDVYDEGLAAGHFLRRGADVYVGKVWPGPSVFPDFTSASTRRWWGGLVGRLVAQGVDGVWIDMNEPSDSAPGAGGTVPNDVACAGDGVPTTMAECHNVYALLEAEATRAGLLAARPGRRPFVLTRAGYAGIQRSAAVWTGDAPSTWATLRTTLPMLLGLGLSGVPFVGSDVGGYSGWASPELFARWMQLGAASPFLRGHVTQGVNDQEPWAFGTEVTDISRIVLEERSERLPYLYGLFREAALTGAPVLRPMVFEFQDEPLVAAVDDQAMLGPSLLVAPVLEPSVRQRSVTFPEGRWYDVHSDAVVEGPATRSVPVTLQALPTFAREGAMVPRAQLVQWTGQQPVKVLTLDVYPGRQASGYTLYEDDGESLDFERGAFSEVDYTLTPSSTGLALRAGGRRGAYSPVARRLVVRFHRLDAGATAVRLDGASVGFVATREALEGLDRGAFYDEGERSLTVAFADRDAFELALDAPLEVSEPGPPVPVRFEVRVPPGTPTDAPVTVATSVNGWRHQPLAWNAERTAASGAVLAPRGAWLEYKYARGGWSTVERWPGCVEAANRYTRAQARDVKRDEVFAWVDRCGAP